jgi:hypothetical protein
MDMKTPDGELLNPLPEAKTFEEIEAECLRLLKQHKTTRKIEHVGIVRTHRDCSGPNWTYGPLVPSPPTTAARREVDKIVKTVASRWVLPGLVGHVPDISHN